MIKSASEQYRQLPAIAQIGILTLILSVSSSLILDSVYPIALILGYIAVYLAVTEIQTLFYVLIFTIPISVTLDVTTTLTFEFPDEPVMWFLLPVVGSLLLSRPNILPIAFWNSPITGMIALLFLWSIITAISGTHFVPSVKYILSKMWMLASFFFLAFLIFRKYSGMRMTAYIFIGMFTLFILFALARQYMDGFDFEMVNDAVMPIYHNHVNYSATISILIPILVLMYSNTKGAMRRFFVLGLILLYLVAVYFAYGRGAWGAVIVSAAMYFIIRWGKVRTAVLLGYSLLILGILWISNDNRYLNYQPKQSSTYMRDNLEDHLVATVQGNDVSSMERVYRWIAAVRMVGDRPVFGVGPNNFYENYKPYRVNGFETWVSRNEERSTTHNYFLLMVTEQGIPGMLLYATLLLVSLVYAQRIYHRSEDRTVRNTAIAIACSLGAFYVNNFLSELIETDEIGSLYYMLLAALIALDLHDRKVIDLNIPSTSGSSKL